MDANYAQRTLGQRLWLAGAFALVAMLVTVGGWLAVDGLGDSGRVPEAVTTGPATATAPGRVAFGAPQVVAGVPWGFALDRQGAASAAVSVVALTGQPEVVFDQDRFDQVAAMVFDPTIVAVQSRQVEAARSQLEVSGWAGQPPSRRMYHFAPLAVRVASFTPDPVAAQVEVWAMTLLGVGDAGGAVFTTSTVDLESDAGDGWRVVGLETVQGPVPVVEAGPSAPGRLRALVREATAALPLPAPAGSGDLP